MAIIVEGASSFWMGSRVELLPADREVAWAERVNRPANPTLRYFLGRYVEADNPNNNGQMWELSALKSGMSTVINAPINWAHMAKRVIGHYVDAELMYPVDAANEGDPKNPFVETLGVLYKFYFPEEVGLIEQANAEGQVFQSMECVSKTIICGGPNGCSKSFAYEGPQSETYCAHLREGASVKQLVDPIFLGGGVLVPPIKPGWTNAKISEISSLFSEAEQEQLYKGIEFEFDNLSPVEWENLMGLVMVASRGTK